MSKTISSKTVLACDLFCGSGGTSTGLMQAASELGLGIDLVAVNHWRTAIDTHAANHPGVTHYCEDLETVNPRQAVPGGHLHLLVASPECTHHSNARGGRPMSDQSRASAWHVLRWADALHIDHILIENVKEFRDWGPLHGCTCGLGDAAGIYGPHTKDCKRGRPITAMKGRLYRQFLSSLRALGYTVSERVVNAADYGDATTRQRLFIQARRGTKRPVWPTPTHMKPGEDPMGLLTEYPKWKPAREIIDWTLPSRSIYARKRPLAPATMARIFAGLRKYSGLPFLVPNLSEREGQAPRTHDIDAPLPTVTTFGGGNLVQPFLIGAGGPAGAGGPQSVADPLGTVLTENHRALVQPYLVILRRHAVASGVEEPVPTLTAGGLHMGLAEPFIVPVTHQGGAERTHDVGLPLPTVTGAHRGELAVCEPYLTEFHGGQGSQNRTRSVEDPVCTLDTSNRLGLAQPFLVSFYGNSTAASLDEPLDTITARDRFALADPQLVTDGLLDKGEVIGWLDIRFRMLQPRELAAAMSFPESYRFAGNREAQVKQIGNSVAVGVAKALCLTILGRHR